MSNKRIQAQQKEFQIAVGKKVRAVRLKTGMGYTPFAAMIPMRAEAYRRIEKGYAAPHITTLKQIADTLGVDIKDFL